MVPVLSTREVLESFLSHRGAFWLTSEGQEDLAELTIIIERNTRLLVEKERWERYDL
jgi:hypothetical protein